MDMHIGWNLLQLNCTPRMPHQADVLRSLQALQTHASEAIRLRLYARPSALPGALASHGQTAVSRPWWPVGMRTTRIVYEQFCLYLRASAEKIDLLHCPAGVVPRYFLKPMVVTVNDTLALTAPQLCPPSRLSLLARMLPISLRRAQCIVTPSNAVRDELLAWNRTLAADKQIADLEPRIRVIPWGMDTPPTGQANAARQEDVALRYGLPPQFVLIAAPHETHQNLLQALQAYFVAAMQHGLPHRLVILGAAGSMTRTFRKEICQHGMDERTLLIPDMPPDDEAVLYEMASLLVAPALVADSTRPLRMAMAAGTPIVCSDLPAYREVAGNAALYAPAGDLPPLREAMETILTDEDKGKRLIKAGEERVTTFTWNKHADALLRCYEDCIHADRQR